MKSILIIIIAILFPIFGNPSDSFARGGGGGSECWIRQDGGEACCNQLRIGMIKPYIHDVVSLRANDIKRQTKACPVSKADPEIKETLEKHANDLMSTIKSSDETVNGIKGCYDMLVFLQQEYGIGPKESQEEIDKIFLNRMEDEARKCLLSIHTKKEGLVAPFEPGKYPLKENQRYKYNEIELLYHNLKEALNYGKITPEKIGMTKEEVLEFRKVNS